MKTKAQLQAEMWSHLTAARVIADKVTAENRDFTDEERKTAEAHLGAIQWLEKQIADLDPEGEKQKQKDREKDITDQISNLGKDMPPQKVYGEGAKGGKWSTAFLSKFSGKKDFITPSGSVGVPSLSDTIPAAGERLETILQALNAIPIDTGSAEYLREVLRQQNAAPVAAGAKKPTSVYELSEVVAPVETIAHLTESIPNQYLADYGNLRRYLDVVLRQGLQLALEYQLINGVGVSPQLQGMLTCPGINVLVPTTSTDPIVLARQAQTVLELLSLGTDGMYYAVHPMVWEGMETTRISVGSFEMNIEGTRQAAPINRSLRQLWGCPVIPCVGMPLTSMLLWHRSAVQLREREGVTITWTENFFIPPDAYDETGSTGFEKNVTKFRAEGRWVFEIFKPDGIVEIDISSGS
jgi:HK97 family phage major capsid protein